MTHLQALPCLRPPALQAWHGYIDTDGPSLLSSTLLRGSWPLSPHRFFRFRFDSAQALTGGLLVAIAVAVAMQVGLGLLVLYWRRWRLGSFEEIVALTATVAGVTMVLLILSVATLRHDLPIGVVLAGSAFTLVLTAGSRCAWRFAREFRQHSELRHGEDVIVFGMGQAGQQIVFTMLTTPESPYHPVALLDDDPGKHHLQFRHLRVSGGRNQLGEVATRTRAGTVVIAIPSAGSELIREIVRFGERFGP